MVGFSYQIQIRHILVDKESVAQLLKETIEEVKDQVGKVKMLMRLAEKYSLCSTKEDGGNLGWLEMACDDPRIREYRPVFENQELEKIVREGIQNRTLVAEEVFGPVKTNEGYHILMIANQFGEERYTEFTGSAI